MAGVGTSRWSNPPPCGSDCLHARSTSNERLITSSMILVSFSSGVPPVVRGCVSAYSRPFNRPIMSRPPPAAKGANSANVSASSSDKPVPLAVLIAEIAALSVGGLPWKFTMDSVLAMHLWMHMCTIGSASCYLFLLEVCEGPERLGTRSDYEPPRRLS
jgi:hypothetical protein